MLYKSAFYKSTFYKSIFYKSMFYKSSPYFTNPIQLIFYKMPDPGLKVIWIQEILLLRSAQMTSEWLICNFCLSFVIFLILMTKVRQKGAIP